MHWLKRDRWKVGIALAGMLLLLILIVWVPVSAAGAYGGKSGLATLVTGTVQATPTEDATVAALNKEKLAQEVQQLKNQNAPDLFGWLRTNAAILLSTLAVVFGGLIGLGRWLADRRSEREKRAEERFQAVVTGLGDEKETARIGAAILLRTFLRPGYEQFYSQAFDLAVAYLRFSEIDKEPEQLTSLRQALITIFKESFSLISDNLISKQFARFISSSDQQMRLAAREDIRVWIRRYLDAARIHLDNAYLARANLELSWMPGAYLRKADLSRANFREADFSGANLGEADLSRANLSEANLSRADLSRANLSGANLSGANLSEADLSKADLSGAALSRTILNKTNLGEVKGLTTEQLETLKDAKHANIDEDP